MWDRADRVNKECRDHVETEWDKAGPQYDALIKDLRNRWKIFA
ncbi:hypothetical protein GCM10009647_085170 [Streptomyces sanglieri]|uniref:Uncharacterized protein n=1 Tax=Streptomyces sanglieri TaxID=193460 RepID=A0ABW2WS13_9ACTN|nr:hypothetical protein [Streptomyces sp. Wh19]MDV9198981.1 hypothetical protein [Streptomyces sp. Wh19]